MTTATTATTTAAADRRRAWWLRQLHEWHWISSALCLVGMLAFAITGITLNHAGAIDAHPTVVSRTATAPAEVLKGTAEAAERILAGHKGSSPARQPLPPALAGWVRGAWGVEAGERLAEWSRDEVYLSLPRPGGDAWVRVALDDGSAEYESTDRGWVSYFNDLHKGRNTGPAWSWFIDIFAVAALVFCITGLLILKMHAAKRALTWPVVGMGLVLPALLALLLIH